MANISEFDVVTIHTAPSFTRAARSAFDCHVLAAVGRTVALYVDDPAAAVRMADVIPDVYLSHLEGTRITALRGMLLSVGAGELRFTAHDDEPLARRQATRIEVELPIVLRASDGESWEGSTLDISAHGAFLATRDGLEAEQLVQVALTLDEGDPVHGQASVVRIEPGHVAIRYSNGSSEIVRSSGRCVTDFNKAKLLQELADAPPVARAAKL
ncbi:MAG: PilZ domain-containing protein [Gaiella sp.]